MHGAPFQWATIFHRQDVSFSSGPYELNFYSALQNTQKYHKPTKVSCSFYHTLIMDEADKVCLLFPQLIEFEGSLESRENSEICSSLRKYTSI